MPSRWVEAFMIMNELGMRMCDHAAPPDVADVAKWIGPEAQRWWTRVSRFIETNYPGVFVPDWYFGGKKWGWALRFKKSKSFCTFIPEKNQFRLLLVFGREEREKVEAELPRLVSHTRADYVAATTFHDGKWLNLLVDGEDVLADIERLLVLKRKPRPRSITPRARTARPRTSGASPSGRG